jgi:hypothetical protein
MPVIIERCKWLESLLFQDLEGFALHTLIRAINGDPIEPEPQGPLKKKKTIPA